MIIKEHRRQRTKTYFSIFSNAVNITYTEKIVFFCCLFIHWIVELANTNTHYTESLLCSFSSSRRQQLENIIETTFTCISVHCSYINLEQQYVPEKPDTDTQNGCTDTGYIVLYGFTTHSLYIETKETILQTYHNDDMHVCVYTSRRAIQDCCKRYEGFSVTTFSDIALGIIC